jgi:hypothetical protein
MSKSTPRNIPIHQESHRLLSNNEEEDHSNIKAMAADYKDYRFFSRLVDGIRKTQESTTDMSLRIQNQALIDHLFFTRRLPPSQSLSTRSNTPPFDTTESDLIFDLEI